MNYPSRRSNYSRRMPVQDSDFNFLEEEWQCGDYDTAFIPSDVSTGSEVTSDGNFHDNRDQDPTAETRWVWSSDEEEIPSGQEDLPKIDLLLTFVVFVIFDLCCLGGCFVKLGFSLQNAIGTNPSIILLALFGRILAWVTPWIVHLIQKLLGYFHRLVQKLLGCCRRNVKQLGLTVAGIALLVLVAVLLKKHFTDPCTFSTTDPYKTLNLSRGSSEKQIKSAYRKLSRQCHPDMVPLSRKSIAQKGFIQIKAAYDVLSDPNSKRVFDACGVNGLELFNQGVDANLACRAADAYKTCGAVGRDLVLSGLGAREACQAARVHKTCGEAGLELMGMGVEANQACQAVKVYQRCGSNGVELLRMGLSVGDACAWARVYQTCGVEGLQLYEQGVHHSEACYLLQLARHRRILEQQYNPWGHHHHGFHRGFHHPGVYW